ncbi:hypothetical protein NQ315_001912 [Exocentrus adspersus]|uniref:Transmembrane inner ear expressed protein n=1 Tax=Exocentrus adspersus TaxID=1586481 RepID=A0AAV8WA67_9CUCU|nr:hypothetical protein NQ315_001912 [Exocentrus adspersus]
MSPTFYANPDEETEPWIERAGIEGYGFRNWHYIFFCFSIFTIFVILVCCCIRIRIPRTKQEIEADYRRKKLTEKFQQRLKLIQNQEMDALDLHTALEIIQEDYRKEQANVACQFDMSPENVANTSRQAPHHQSFGRKISNILKFTKSSNQ